MIGLRLDVDEWRPEDEHRVPAGSMITVGQPRNLSSKVMKRLWNPTRSSDPRVSPGRIRVSRRQGLASAGRRVRRDAMPSGQPPIYRASPNGMAKRSGSEADGHYRRKRRCASHADMTGGAPVLGNGHADEDRRLHVAIVDADRTVRHGLASLLGQDARLHIMDPVGSIRDMRMSGLHFDVCFVDVLGAGTTDEVLDLLREVPAVVCTPSQDWRNWVGTWTCGARGVVSREVAGVPLADAAWDAVYRPDDVQPQLARALLDGIAACALQPSAELTEVLAKVAEGGRVPSVLSASGIPASVYERDVRHLREMCAKVGLGILRMTPRHDSEPGQYLEPSVVPPEALALTSRIREVLRHYADGDSYQEIAETLRISEATVKTHVLTALDKYGIISNRSAEVRLLFAVYMSGRHRRPDLIRQRLDRLRTGSDPPLPYQ